MAGGGAERPILLAVEDEVPIVELLATLSAPLGVQLVAAPDGKQALALLERIKPALITLDLVLPDIDGYTVLEQVRRRGRLDDVPVVVISALADSSTVKRAYALGASDFIGKPFNVAIVEAKLRMFLRMVQLAEEVREREHFLEEVMDHLSSGILVVDAAGRIRRINPAGAAALGLGETRDLAGRLVADVAPGAEPMCAPTSSVLPNRVELPAANESGPRVLGYTTARLGDGGAVAVFRELSAVEQARREADERARYAQLSLAARRFAHEVRNPLAAIAAAAQVIARDDAERTTQKRLARAIESESLRIAGLVSEYVERQAPAGPTKESDLGALLEEVVEVNLLGNSGRERISLAVAPSLPRVLVDAARLKQVVLNLLLNAVTATAEGGYITVSAVAEADGVRFAVRDTGPGIPLELMPRIFEEGFTTRAGGNGLGLPIAKRIVEESGGSLRAESGGKAGTVFTVWLRGGGAE